MKRRSASALVLVLVALSVVAAMGVEIARTALSYRQAASDTLRRRQAQIVAEAAIERAALSLATSPEYRGERWEPKLPEATSGRSLAICHVEIEVAPSTDSQPARIRVLATVGESARRVATHRSELELTPSGNVP